MGSNPIGLTNKNQVVKPYTFAARTPTACDFTDRMRQLTHDVRMIELAAETAEERQAIVMACRNS